jgi:hypothetical protein
MQEMSNEVSNIPLNNNLKYKDFNNINKYINITSVCIELDSSPYLPLCFAT